MKEKLHSSKSYFGITSFFVNFLFSDRLFYDSACREPKVNYSSAQSKYSHIQKPSSRKSMSTWSQESSCDLLIVVANPKHDINVVQ